MMRWQTGRRSTNVIDRRGWGGGGGMGRMVMVGGGGGMGLLILLVLAMCLGVNPLSLLSQVNVGVPSGPSVTAPASPEEEKLREFVSVVLADTEDVWHELFRQSGTTYEEPELVLFTQHVESACGLAGSSVGPFYCPLDERVYLDLDFFAELDRRLGAPGDFAQAYVIAHEVGHHVQRLMGITEKVHSMRGRLSEADYNDLSVRLELQADYFAGVWAHHAQRARKILEPGDLEEALNAASAVGDDRLQRRSQGYVVPDSFTHGTSAQRIRWFKKGFESGRISEGDTFTADEL
jgi:uncharacterized protein